MTAPDYASLSIATDDMQKRGFTKIFIENDFKTLNPDEWEILETYRFEGMSSTGDNSIVFGLQHKITKSKGLVVNGYGIYSDELKDGFLSTIKRK